MKRLGVFLLCVFLCIGCASSDSEESSIEMDLSKIHFDTSEKDVDLSTLLSGGRFCATQDVDYILGRADSWIYYYDKKNGIFGKMCGRPECEHKGNGCNAYVMGLGDLQVYEGYLYFMTGPSVLTRMGLDGMNRETVRVVNDRAGINGNWVIHRDKVYTQVSKQVVDDGKSYEDLYIYEFDLNSQEEGKLLFYQRYEKSVFVEWYFRGDYVYFLIEELSGGPEITRSIYLYDIEQNQFEEVSYQSKYGWGVLDAYPYETKMTILEKEPNDMRMIEYDLQTGKETELFRIEATEFMGVFSRNMDHILAYEIESNPEGRRIRLLNMEGELEKEWTIPAEWTLEPLNSDEEGFLLEKDYRLGTDGGGTYYSLWKVPYDGGEAQLLVDKHLDWKTGNEIIP